MDSSTGCPRAAAAMILSGSAVQTKGWETSRPKQSRQDRWAVLCVRRAVDRWAGSIWLAETSWPLARPSLRGEASRRLSSNFIREVRRSYVSASRSRTTPDCRLKRAGSGFRARPCQPFLHLSKSKFVPGSYFQILQVSAGFMSGTIPAETIVLITGLTS